MTSLEEQFSEGEKRRRESEEKKTAVLQGLPSEDRKALSELVDLKTLFSERLEGQSLQRLFAVIDLAKQAVEIRKDFIDLKEATLSTDEQSRRLLNVAEQINGVGDNLVGLLNLLTSDLDERRRLRQKEFEILDKLGRYLEEWL